MTVRVKLVNKIVKVKIRRNVRVTIEMKVRVRGKVKVNQNLIVINRGKIFPTKCSERLLKNTSEPANQTFVKNNSKQGSVD